MSGEREQVGWAVLELLGHRKLAGYVQEATLAGGAFLRIDVCLPADASHDGESFEDEDGAPLLRIASQFYPPSSVYCLTPTTREMCLRMAQRYQPEPITRWELPAPEPTREDVNEAEEVPW